jgi:hypothetical protein
VSSNPNPVRGGSIVTEGGAGLFQWGHLTRKRMLVNSGASVSVRWDEPHRPEGRSRPGGGMIPSVPRQDRCAPRSGDRARWTGSLVARPGRKGNSGRRQMRGSGVRGRLGLPGSSGMAAPIQKSLGTHAGDAISPFGGAKREGSPLA